MTDFRVIGLEDHIERWLTAQGKVFFDSEDQPKRLVGVTQDITQRKQLEGRLSMLDVAKSDFLKLISHEFRTPLNGLLGVGELLLDEVPSSGSHDKLQGLFDRGRRRILSMLDDALLLAEIDVNEQQFRYSLVSLHTVLTRAIERSKDFAESRGVAITPMRAIPDVVFGDEELLIRAFSALLETGVKFSKKGGRIGLSHSVLPECLNVVIESDALSIPPTFLPKFFDILAIGETLTPGGDLGLSAPVASRILSLFGGSVGVTNRHPSGILLTVSLKVAAPD